jgi:hypothetical protein
MKRLLKTLALAVTALALSACVIAPYPRYGGYANGAYDADIAVANVPPPAPYAEIVPVIPFAGAVWLSGHWGWSGGRHQWESGRWDRGRPGYGWSPNRWEQRGGQWHLRGGGWRRR